MAVTTVLFGFCLIISIIGSNAGGQLSILHSPDSLKFTGQSKVYLSLLKEIYSASLGLSIDENSDWNGLIITDPFNTPEAAVEFYIEGVSNLSLPNARNYELEADEYDPDTFESIRHRIKQRDTNDASKLVEMVLTDPNELNNYPAVWGEITTPKYLKKTDLKCLKYDVEEDQQFLIELENLNAIKDQITSGFLGRDNIIDFYSFRFRTLHALTDFHGPASCQHKEAVGLLVDGLQQLNKVLKRSYDGSVLVTVVSTDVAHTRRTVRAVRDDNVIEAGYETEYAAIFNIILWFGVVLTFTLVAIVYTMMDMDPGRDSIIYRMTSTRMKKDN